MKKLMMKSLAIFIIIGAFAVISFAQDLKEKVQLTAGGEGKSLTRTLAPEGSLEVTFKANAGQTISYTAGYDFKDSDLSVYLGKIGFDEVLKSSGPKEPNEFLVEKNGEYVVVVRNNTRKRVTTTLYLDLFNPEDMEDNGGSDVKTEALSFEGSDQASVNKTIPANGTMKFTFDGDKGTTAIVNVTDRTNKLTVVFNENPNQKADTTIALNKDVSRKLTRTGEYTIEVINQTAKSVKFDLSVTIDSFSGSGSGNTDSSGAERIQFARGETSTSVTKDIPANGSVGFLMNVKKGQTIGYTVGYDFKSSDVNVLLTEPGSSDDASQSSGPKKLNEFVVKKNGDHQLSVFNTTNKKITITLYLDIE